MKTNAKKVRIDKPEFPFTVEQVLELFEPGIVEKTKVELEYGEYQGDKNAIKISIHKMYEKPETKQGFLDTLLALRTLSGKTELDEGYYYEHGGCETCDYGSDYGYEFIAFTPSK